MLLGFTVKHFISNPNIHGKDVVFQNYWIFMDLMIMFLRQTYIAISLYMKVDGEIKKNIYSLYFIQLKNTK